MRTSLLALIAAGCLGGTVGAMPPGASAIPVLTPKYFASSTNPTVAGNNSVATPYALSGRPFGTHMLVAQPQEPTTLYGSGYQGKMALKLDCPDRMRVPAGTTQRIVAGAGNLDPGKGWFRQVDFYAIGDLDANGNALGATAAPGGPGSTKVTATTQVKYARTVAAGTFFSCGYAFDLDNTAATPQDRYVAIVAIGTPVNGYARRTKPIIVLLEGTQRLAPLGSGSTATAVNVYADPGGSDISGNGTSGSPYQTIGYALTKASSWPAGSVYVQNTSGANPALLDYVYGSGVTGVSGSGWDHKIVCPPPGSSGLVYMKRTNFGALDLLYSVPGTTIYQPHSDHQFPYNKVIVAGAVIDMANIGAFGARLVSGSYAGSSMGFINTQFANSVSANDHIWTGALIDSTMDTIIPASSGGDYQAFMANCSGRLASTGQMTLVSGGHFATSWDAGYIPPRVNSFAEFDYQTRQMSFTCAQLAGGPVPVASVTRDPVGQRTVIGLAPEPFAGACSITVSNGVATIVCYTDATLSVPVVPANLLAFAGGSINVPSVTFASESGNPLAGGTYALATFVTAASVPGATFTVACPGVANGSSTAPCHFSINSMGSQVPQLNGANGEGNFATLITGAAKTVFADSDGGSANNVPALSTPDYGNAYNTPSAALQYLSATGGQVNPGGLALQPNLGLSSTNFATASLSGQTLTFAGTQVAITGNQLQTTSVLNDKVAVLQGALPVGMPNMALQSGGNTGATGWRVGDQFAVEKGTPSSANSWAIGQVTQIDSGTTSGIGKPTGVTLISAGQYVATPPNPAWGVTFLPASRTDGTSPTGIFTVTCSLGGVSNTFVAPTLWGMSVHVGSRVIGRVARNTNNTGVALADGTPAWSFYIEGWDGGADITTASNWALSWDLHGISQGDAILFPASADLGASVTVSVTKGSTNGSDLIPGPSGYAHPTIVRSVASISQSGTTYVAGTNFTVSGSKVTWLSGSQPTSGSTYSVTYTYATLWDVASVAGPVVTLTAAPSLAASTGLTVTVYASNTLKQIVLIERYYNDYGVPVAPMSNGVAPGDLMRIVNLIQHSDRFQIQEPGSAFKKIENVIKSCCRQWGNDLQPFQQDKLTTFAVGSLTTHAAGDGYGANDGCDVQFTLPALPVSSAPNVPTTYWIDGVAYNGYTITSNYAGVSGAAIFSWSQDPGGQNNWIDVHRAIWVKILTGSMAGKVFRLYSQTISGTTATLTLLDTQGAVSPPGAPLTLAVGDTYQHPLPIDDGTVLSVCNGASNPIQGRIFTNNPANPGTGRVHRPFLGALATTQTISASPNGYNGALGWYTANQLQDTVILSSVMGVGVAGQTLKVTVPGGGMGPTVAWNNVGWLQATESISNVPVNTGGYTIDPTSFKGSTMCRVGVIDSLHAGFQVNTSTPYISSIEAIEALFANSNFNRVQQSVSVPAQAISLTAFAAPCALDASATPTLVDPENFTLVTNLATTLRVAVPQFPWDCFGNPLKMDGTDVIGARMAA